MCKHIWDLAGFYFPEKFGSIDIVGYTTVLADLPIFKCTICKQLGRSNRYEQTDIVMLEDPFFESYCLFPELK